MLFGFRFYREIRAWLSSAHQENNVLIYGAGSAGATLAREVLTNASLKSRLVGFLDDDPRKPGSKLMGVPIFGRGDQAGEIIQMLKGRGTPVDEILVAMPTATSRQIRDAVEKGKKTGLRCTAVPALSDLLSGKLSVGRRLEARGHDCLRRRGLDRRPEPGTEPGVSTAAGVGRSPGARGGPGESRDWHRTCVSARDRPDGDRVSRHPLPP